MKASDGKCLGCLRTQNNKMTQIGHVYSRVKLFALNNQNYDIMDFVIQLAESDICTFALLKNHYAANQAPNTDLFTADTRPTALQNLYEAATKTPVHLMRQMDRWRRDGHRSSRFFLCTPVLGEKRRRIRNRVDIDIETRMPAAVKELRRWTSTEALGDITVTPDCFNRINTLTDGECTDGTLGSDDEGIDHKLPSPEEQLQVVALKFPAEIVAVDISGRSFDRMSIQRRSLLHNHVTTDVSGATGSKTEGAQEDSNNGTKRRTRTRRPRSRRRNTLAGTDQKEIANAVAAGEDSQAAGVADAGGSSSADKILDNIDPESTRIGTGRIFGRSKSSDLLRSNTSNKKESPDFYHHKKSSSHFNTLKQWGKSRYDRFMNKSSTSSANESQQRADSSTGSGSHKKSDDIDDFNIYETVTMKRRRNIDKDTNSSRRPGQHHERNPSISSSEKSSVNLPITASITSSVMNMAVKLRESSAQRRLRRSGSKDEQPHSSSGNWSASSESGRASIGSEITTTTQPKSTTSCATSSNSLNNQQQQQQPQAPNSVNSRRRFCVNTSASSSITSEGTLTPDIIHDLHEDGETSSVYSCDTEGYYTSFHMDSGLKTLKEEELPCTPLHSTSAFSNSSSNAQNTALSAENEYELFGKGSTSTTTSSAGTVCTTLRASDSSRSLSGCPAVPERKSSLSKCSNNNNKSPESSLERDEQASKTGTVKRSPAGHTKALVHNQSASTTSNGAAVNGDVSPDSGHNTSSSPIESINSPNGVRSGSEFEFSESSDMEGTERIERIRVKTTINSSRIPSMCVITPLNSDDESIKSFSSNQNMNSNGRNDDYNLLNNQIPDYYQTSFRNNMEPKSVVNGPNKVQVINVNPTSGYATLETVDANDNLEPSKNLTNKVVRAPSPSGGTLTINPAPLGKSPPSQPIIKASLMPLNSMFGKLRTNLANFAHRRDSSKSPNRNNDSGSNAAHENSDSGDYVTLADVRNNNNTSSNDKVKPETLYANSALGKSAPSEKVRETEYISLDELPCNDTAPSQGDSIVASSSSTTVTGAADSLERKKQRQGARVTLDAEGKVVYSSDSLKRRKGAHTTFEPGPFVKPPTTTTNNNSTTPTAASSASTPTHSPLPCHRTPKPIRPVLTSSNSNATAHHEGQPQPQGGMGKLVIKAAPAGHAVGGGGLTSPITSEIIRVPQSTIVAGPNHRPMSPKSRGGAYVHIQDAGRSLSPNGQDTKDRAPSPSNNHPAPFTQPTQMYIKEMYRYNASPQDQMPSYFSQRNLEQDHKKHHLDEENQYYHVQQKTTPSYYQTLPSKKSQYFQKILDNKNNPERSVTPDITRGMERNRNIIMTLDRKTATLQPHHRDSSNVLHQYHRIGIPVSIPDVTSLKLQQHQHQQKVPSQYDLKTAKTTFVPTSNSSFKHISPYKTMEQQDNNESLKISPIDPRLSGSFHSSTPSSSKDLKAARNLENFENKLLSPKKSTMSNEELYAVIHKSKKKMNILPDEVDSNRAASPAKLANTGDFDRGSPVGSRAKSPETGYLKDNNKFAANTNNSSSSSGRSRLSWSPTKGEYIDFNSDIDKISPPNDSRSRQSWACNDRKKTNQQQTSRLDFKKLLLQKSTVLSQGSTKKISAVEQLKLSKQQIQQKCGSPPPMDILELSGSPRSLVNRKFQVQPNQNQNQNQSCTPEKAQNSGKNVPKIMSPRCQWRFANPRTDVLSSTILEDCREDESPNNSLEKNKLKCDPATTDNVKPVVQSRIVPQQSPQSTNRVKLFSAIDDCEKKPFVSISQKLQERRAQFFTTTASSDSVPEVSKSNLSNNGQQQGNGQSSSAVAVLPALETDF